MQPAQEQCVHLLRGVLGVSDARDTIETIGRDERKAIQHADRCVARDSSSIEEFYRETGPVVGDPVLPMQGTVEHRAGQDLYFKTTNL
jgi:hypothetical protein